MRAAVLLVAIVGGSVLAQGVDAAVTYRTQSTLTTGVTAPLVEFALGTSASRSSFVAGLALSTNRTAFSGTLLARAGGAVVVKDLVDLASKDASARTVTLSATQVVNARVTALNWTVRNGAATIATLELTNASPSVSFSLPAGATYALDLGAMLQGGAGHNDADVALATAISVAVGAIAEAQSAATPTLSAAAPLVPFGALVAGSTGGPNGSAGQANISAFVSSITSTTTNVLYLNNTGGTTWYARFVLTSSTGASGIVLLNIGINNGSQQAQVTGSVGSITSTGGSYVGLAPGSANQVYITQAVTVGSTASFVMDVYASDATNDTAYVVTSLALRLT